MVLGFHVELDKRFTGGTKVRKEVRNVIRSTPVTIPSEQNRPKSNEQVQIADATTLQASSLPSFPSENTEQRSVLTSAGPTVDVVYCDHDQAHESL